MRQQRRYSRKTQGFSLMELLIVITIIGVLLAVAIPNMTGASDEGKRVAAASAIKNLETTLTLYQAQNSALPSTEQGLKALVTKPSGEPIPRNWQGPYIKGAKDIPVDPWGREYRYASPGAKSGGDYDVFSLGKDGKESDDDIGNWQR
ncbi:type II secretion system major pseudopilin GspG [Thiofilum flexile]|uniref:type II secretion system major pseudopilin GspG n=1 Tax=Thiofilum flexile TaxID=125627 RepID=UPI00035C4BF9|nr:type II secretion system major pseudopilin GspG [Thiofilum flexile]